MSPFSRELVCASWFAVISEAGLFFFFSFLEKRLFEAPPALPLCRAVCPRATFPCPVPASFLWLCFPRCLPLPGLPWLGWDPGRRVGMLLLQPVSFSTSLLSFTHLLLHLAPELMLATALVPQGRLYLRHEVMDSPSHPPGLCLFHHLIAPVA